MGVGSSKRFKPNSKFPGQTYRVIEVAAELGYTRFDVDKMFAYFGRMDVYDRGLVSIREFVVVNKISCERMGALIFRIFDKKNTGTFNFERFLIAMWNILSFDEDDLASFAFQVFDTDHSGVLSMDEVNSIVNIAWGGDYRSNQRVLFALKRLDENNDGEINLAEFVLHVKEFPILLFPIFEMQGERSLVGHIYI
jgi:Ca2+-binding EF-hand superfamily protein